MGSRDREGNGGYYPVERNGGNGGAKYRPNEVPLGEFNFKIKHENVDKIN